MRVYDTAAWKTRYIKFVLEIIITIITITITIIIIQA
jgi:hypothetical protein